MTTISQKVHDDVQALMRSNEKLSFHAAYKSVVASLSEAARNDLAFEPSKPFSEVTTYAAPKPKALTFGEVAAERANQIMSERRIDFMAALHTALKNDQRLREGYALRPGDLYA